MSDPSQAAPPSPAAGLQFDRVEPVATAPVSADRAGIPCTGCGASMRNEYYSIAGKSICASCRASVERRRMKSRTPRAFGKAFGFGLAAAIAGAIVYYSVMALLDLEIGIVAILIGWMVGRAIQKALPGGGMRRYQILAAVLTYFAVGLAYMPVLFKEVRHDAAAKKAQTTASIVQQGSVTTDSAGTTTAADHETNKGHPASMLLGIGILIAVAFSLPVVAAFGSGSGIISALIIAFGIRQAWRMTGAPAANITGPFRVGGAAA